MVSNSFFEYCKNNNKLLLGEWDYSKNEKEPNEYCRSSGKNVYWLCDKGHSWKSRIADRVRGNGCPYCAGKRPIVGVNDLATVYPRLASEWDYSKNLKPPYEYMPNSGKKFGGFVLRDIIGRQLLIVEHVVTGVSIALDKL